VGNTELMSKTGRASGLARQGTIRRTRRHCANGWGVQARTRKKIKSLLTQPTSLEMLKKSVFLKKVEDHISGRVSAPLLGTLTHFALVNNTASLWSVPLARAMLFPSGDQPKSQITPEVKWVNCFVGPPKLTGPLQRLGVPDRMSRVARERPSGVQRTQ
jgi:hypothetical protein